MAEKLIDRAFYDAICAFDRDDKAREYYYTVMNTETGKTRSGRRETVRDQILRVYAMLFGDDLQLAPGAPAGLDEVEATADRLYIGAARLDPQHWYRMQHHFPIIDEDNYDRFAALVIADLSAGPLHDAVIHGGDMLLVGEKDPLLMTADQRKNQQARAIDLMGEV